MKITRRILAACATVGLFAGALGAPAVAGASEITPAQVANGAELAKISSEPYAFPKDYPTSQIPEWYKAINRKGTDTVRGYADKPLVQVLSVYSPSMDRTIPIVVKKSPKPNSPTYYLLNGAGGGEQDTTDWVSQTNILDFMMDKDVNLVLPMAGKFSYYIDWANQEKIPGLGGPGAPEGKKQMWETFLVKELPGPMEKYLQANNKRGISGMSMAATSSLLLAEHNPGFYDAVGSFSGCAATSTPLPYQFARLTMNNGSGSTATVQDVFGPQGSAHNVHNDALVHAEKLRGAKLYVSNGSGLASKYDTAGFRREQGIDPGTAFAGSAQTTVVGGVIEAATNSCTHDLKVKLDAAGIPADFTFHNVGTHSWPSWAQDIELSWKSTFSPALGVE